MRTRAYPASGPPPPDGTGSTTSALDACMDRAFFGQTYPGLVALAPAASGPRQTLSLSPSPHRALAGTAAVVLDNTLYLFLSQFHGWRAFEAVIS
jgi:hypothetical protein